MSIFSNSSGNNPLAGIFLLVFALFLFSLQDVVIKFFSDQYSVLQIVFVRGVIAGSLMYIAACLFGNRQQLVPNRPLLSTVRGLLGFTSYTSYYLAVASLPLAEVVAIVFTAPLFVTVMSGMLLREKVGIRRWSAVLVGFVGILIMLGPSGQFDQLGVILSLVSAVSYASQSILTRYLSADHSPLSLSFSITVIFTLTSGILSLMMLGGLITLESSHPSLAFLMRDWEVPNALGLTLMIFLGFNGALAFYSMSKAYCVAPASTIAPFEYTYMIWAVVFGYLLWTEIPRATTLLGMSILVASSLYIWQRERWLARNSRVLSPIESGHQLT
ncbi:MAG: S-adenosylmethionine uptake transporter [Gammaproteobacteria bacterium]|jgi:S-adenosylmethionine uptake transporter